MADYRVECPCGKVLTAGDQEGLIKEVQAHAKEVHNQEMTAEQIRATMATEAGS